MFQNKILTYYSQIKQIGNKVMPIPRMALIYPTYLCNFKCSHCLYSTMKNEHASLDFHAFKDLIDELSSYGVQSVEFCGGGEPTLYKQFSKIVEHIHKRGMKFGILTNGSMLHKYGKLLTEVSSYIRISCDANTQSLYSSYTNQTKFKLSDLLNNISYLLKSRKNPHCKIGIKTLVSHNNIYSLSDMIPQFKNIGVDYIQLKSEIGTPTELTDYEKMFWDTNINNTYNDFVRCDLIKTHINCDCFLSPIHTMIDSKGDIYVCCYYQYRRDSHKIGNIKDGWGKSWFSQHHWDVISKIKQNECNVYDCRFHTYNNYIKELDNDKSSHIEFI